MKNNTLPLLALCLASSLAACGKNYPDPPKKITKDTCANMYLDMHPDFFLCKLNKAH